MKDGSLKTRKELVDLFGRRSANFYHVHGLCCSEAIILVLCRGFGSDLPDDIAVSIGAGLCGGMGGGECVCGALSGAEVGLGAFLAPSRAGGLSKRNMRKCSKLLHDNFKKEFVSTYCNDLTAEFAGDRKAKMKNCGSITEQAAKIAAEILLEFKPGLLSKADIEFLQSSDTKISLLLKKLGIGS
jgi:C_GCAxxG_C_C family probable redox protein